MNKSTTATTNVNAKTNINTTSSTSTNAKTNANTNVTIPSETSNERARLYHYNKTMPLNSGNGKLS